MEDSKEPTQEELEERYWKWFDIPPKYTPYDYANAIRGLLKYVDTVWQNYERFLLLIEDDIHEAVDGIKPWTHEYHIVIEYTNRLYEYYLSFIEETRFSYDVENSLLWCNESQNIKKPPKRLLDVIFEWQTPDERENAKRKINNTVKSVEEYKKKISEYVRKHFREKFKWDLVKIYREKIHRISIETSKFQPESGKKWEEIEEKNEYRKEISTIINTLWDKVEGIKELMFNKINAEREVKKRLTDNVSWTVGNELSMLKTIIDCSWNKISFHEQSWKIEIWNNFFGDFGWLKRQLEMSIKKLKPWIALLYAICCVINGKVTSKNRHTNKDIFKYFREFKDRKPRSDCRQFGSRKNKQGITEQDCLDTNEIFIKCEIGIRVNTDKEQHEKNTKVVEARFWKGMKTTIDREKIDIMIGNYA